MVLGQDGTSAGIEEQNEQQDEQLSVTSAWGADHTFGTSNSYLEDPMQGVEDLQEAADGDENDGGFADPASFFVGTSDPDGDGSLEETAGGHPADLPEPDSDAEPSGDSEDDYQLTADDLPSVPSMPSMPDVVQMPTSGSSSGGSSMMTVVAVVVAAVAAVVALAGGGESA